MDNWKHRSAKMRCGTCMWWVEKVRKEVPETAPHTADWAVEKMRPEAVSFGRCRRHAPTMSGFPATFGSDWCGDHKLDENAAVGG
jgi:hypothetical protein